MDAAGQSSRRLRIAVEALVALFGAGLVAWGLLADRAWFEHHLYWRYCAVDPKELARAHVTRAVVAALGVAIAVVVRPRAGRWAARRTPRALLGLAARVGIPTLLAVLACEYILRAKHLPHDAPRPLDLPDSHEVPVYGWVHDAPRTKTLTYGTHRTTFFADADGNRVRSADEVVDRSKPTILFGGESITLGLGLEAEQTYPSRVGDALGAQSINLSVTAYGTDQAYLRVRDELPRLARPIAVVMLVVPVQLVRNTDGRRAHHVPRADGTFEEIAREPEWWTSSPLHKLFDSVVGYHSTEAVQIARATIAATSRDARAHGAYPLFLMTNWGPACLPDDSGSPPLERALFEGLDAPHVRVDLDTTWWDEAADHPDARAHARLAEAVVAALREHVDVRSATGVPR
jgi:hypothetical protein